MIYSLKGLVAHIKPNVAIIECNNIGFKCNISDHTFSSLKINQECFVFVHMSVKEDGIDLFGFSTSEELKCFKTLINISGIGPKAAISVLSQFTPQTLAIAVYNNDYKLITKCQGIGTKTAQRICLELKDKLELDELNSSVLSSFGNSGDINQNKKTADSLAFHEATEALKSLGYSETDILKTIQKYEPSLSVEEIIKKALKEL